MNENSVKQDAQQKGIFFCAQPDKNANRTIDYSVKLDPCLVLLTLDGNNFNIFMSLNNNDFSWP